MTWIQIKQWVAWNNVTFKTEDVKLLCEQKFDENGKKRMTPSVWSCEKNWKKKVINQEVARLIIRPGCSAGNSSHSSVTEVKEHIQYDDQLLGSENLAWNSIKR